MQSDSRTLLTSNASASSSSTAGKPDRLYVGNLSPSVDEYTLIQVFQKYGQITKLDFMFHKTGVLKGKPRGYAFVEFSSKDVSRLTDIRWGRAGANDRTR
jgi:RNA recognition motif-containing protein